MRRSTLSGVEVVQLESGNALCVRVLSEQRERAGARRAAAVVALAILAAAGASYGIGRVLDKAIYLPAFVALWSLIGLGVGHHAVRRVARRLGRYTVGPRLESDAFAQVANDFDLVARRGSRFELTLLPGMHGHIESGRAPLPIEALVQDQRTVVSLDEGGSAEVAFGASRFVIRSRRSLAASPLPRDWMRPFARSGILAVQLGLVASLFCLVPSSRVIDDRWLGHPVAKATTPWEAEKWLRIEAQRQAPSLYTCFDALPMACQRAGYVGIGVALSRDGDIRSQWIARSTYGAECPVEKCMSDVISTWQFDPIPQAMRVILPVQVLRTEKPLAGVRVAEHVELQRR